MAGLSTDPTLVLLVSPLSLSETSQRVAICLCQILPPLPTQDLTYQHFRNEKMTKKIKKNKCQILYPLPTKS